MSKFKIVKMLPTAGNFVCIWQYDGAAWSQVYSYESGYLEVWSDDEGIFIPLIWRPCTCHTCEFVIATGEEDD